MDEKNRNGSLIIGWTKWQPKQYKNDLVYISLFPLHVPGARNNRSLLSWWDSQNPGKKILNIGIGPVDCPLNLSL